MLKNQTYSMQPNFRTPPHRILLWTGLLIACAILGTMLVLTASANPPAAADMRIEGLVSQLSDERLTASRHTAQQNLEELGEAAVPALSVALRSENPVLRRNAADMLGFIASPLALTSLKNTLKTDPVPNVRSNAAYALGEIDSFAAVTDLQHAALFDGSNLVRQSAQDSLARIHTRAALATGIPETEINGFAVAPQNANLIYLTTRRDIVLSQDGGKTWRTYPNALPSVSSTLSISPADSQVLYAGIDSAGMYKSTDGGRTWNVMSNGLPIMPGARFVVTAITVDPTEPQRVMIAAGALLGTSNVEFYPTGIMVSNNGGQDWMKLQDNATQDAVTQLGIRANQLYALAGSRVVKYSFD